MNQDWINTLYNFTDCALLFFLSVKVLQNKPAGGKMDHPFDQ